MRFLLSDRSNIRRDLANLSSNQCQLFSQTSELILFRRFIFSKPSADAGLGVFHAGRILLFGHRPQ